MNDHCCFEAHENSKKGEQEKEDRPTPGPTLKETKQRCFAEEDHENQCEGKDESDEGDDKPVPGGRLNEPGRHSDEDNSAETAPLMERYYYRVFMISLSKFIALYFPSDLVTQIIHRLSGLLFLQGGLSC